MISSLIALLVYLLIVGIVLWLALYIVDTLPAAQPFQQVARVILTVIGCLFLILILLNFLGVAGGLPMLR